MSHLQKGIFVVATALVLSLPPALRLIPGLEIYDEKRLLQVALLLLVGLFFVGTPHINLCAGSIQDENNNKEELLPPLAKWGIALFLLLGLLSTAVNGIWYHGLQQLSLYILLFAFLLFTAGIARQSSRRFTQFMALLLLLFGGLYALRFFMGYGMYQLEYLNFPLWPDEMQNASLYGWANIRFFNQTQVWTLPLLVLFACGVKNPPRVPNPWRIGIKYFFFFLSALWVCFILESGGRGVTIALLIAPCISLIVFKERAHRYIKTYLMAIVTGVALKFILFDWLAGGGISRTLFKEGSGGRLQYWPEVIQAALQQPFLGYGPMSVALVDGIIVHGSPHNSVIQLLYEFGIPAMLIAVGLVLWGLVSWIKQSRESGVEFSHSEDSLSTEKMNASNMNIRIALSTSLLAGAGYSLFSGVIVTPLSQLWMVLVAGWALGIYRLQEAGRRGQEERRDKSRPYGKLIFKALVIAAVVFMSYSLVRDVPNLEENQRYYFETQESRKYHPRFWQQGKIDPSPNPFPIPGKTPK